MAEISQEALTPQIDDEATWHRVAPIAILYYIEKFVFLLVNNVIYMLPGLIVLWDEIKANPWTAAAITGAIISLMAFFAVLSFVMFRYRLHEGSVEVKSGVFFKKHTNLPFNRIQNVKIEQPFYYRFFGYASLAFDSGGSLSQEAVLIALKLTHAQELRTAINEVKADIKADAEADASATSVEHSEETVINTRSIGDLAMHGITSNRVYLILAALAPFIEHIIDFFKDALVGFGIDAKAHWDNDPMWQLGLYVMVLFLILVGIMTLLSILGAIIMFFGYTLSKTKNKLIRRSGLITKHEVAVPLSRVQLAILKQDWLDTLFGRINLRLDQLNAQIQSADPSTVNNKLIVPSVFLYQCRDILSEVFAGHQVHAVQFHPISRLFISRHLLLIALPLSIAAWGLAIHNTEIHMLFAALITVLLCGGVYLRWRRWGFAVSDEYVYIRKGLLGIDRYCLPVAKVQRVSLSQSYFMQRRGLKTIKIQLASGSYKIPLLPAQEADDIAHVLLYKVASEAKSWM